MQALTITDEELVARSMDGDADSFNQLIKRWERPIYALAYRTLGREDDARDVCQETFLRAYRAINGFKGQAKFVERDDDNHKAVLHGEGRDTTGKGNADAMITAQLARIDVNSTKCVVSTDLRVTGKVAQFGRGIMADVSKKLMAQFAHNLNTMLDHSGDPVDEPADEPAVSTSEAAAPADAPGSAAPVAADVAAPAGADSAPAGDGATEPTPAPTVRKIDGPASEPIELSGIAGTAVLKRLLPALGGLVVLLLVFRRLGKR